MTTLSKQAQHMAMDGLDGEDVTVEEALTDLNELKMKEIPLEVIDEVEIEEDPLSMEEHDGETVLEIDSDADGDADIVFNLSRIPGADDQSDLLQPEIEVEEEEEVQVDDDKWSWTLANFGKWLDRMLDENDPEFPRHSGRDTAGLERIIAYLDEIDKHISKACKQDFRNVLNMKKIEVARDTCRKGIAGARDRMEEIESFKYPSKNKSKKKKKADDDSNELVKEAGFSGRMVVTCSVFVSGISRVLINGMVSGGHDIEDMFKKLDKKFKFSDRDKFEIMQVLEDMGYAMRRDRGFLLDEEIDTTRSDNFDWAANYPG